MIEAQQKVIDAGGQEGMAYIFVDAGLTHGRRLLEHSIAQEQGAAALAAI
jgi:hypothetical protein